MTIAGAAVAGDDGVAAAMARFRQELGRTQGSGALAAAGPRLDTVRQALTIVLRDYVRPVSADTLADAAIAGLHRWAGARAGSGGEDWADAALTGMMSSLDAYSTYLTERRYGALRDRVAGRFGGIGVEVTLDKDRGAARVVSPLDGGPAAAAGLRAGDLITEIDGVAVAGQSLEDLSERTRGEPGSMVSLTVATPSARPRTIALTRRVIKVEPVSVRVDGSIVYLRVSTFNLQVAGAFDQAVVEAGRLVGGRPAGVVLDLRNNPGGLVSQAVAVAGRFLTEGAIVSVRGRRPADTVNHEANRGDAFAGSPLIVLINGGSASSAEIVAAALQDHRRALLIGSRSFGKGSVQTTSALDPGGALTLTTAQYHRPAGSAVECLGVEPNVVVASEGAGETGAAPHCATGALPPGTVAVWRMADVCPDVSGRSQISDPAYACARAALLNGVVAGR